MGALQMVISPMISKIIIKTYDIPKIVLLSIVFVDIRYHSVLQGSTNGLNVKDNT